MFTLDRVVPWGRSFDEYCRMFALTGADLQSSILGCADGPTNFNAEGTRRGMRIMSVDPIYQLAEELLRERVAAAYDEIIEQTRRNAGEFVWDSIPSIEELGRIRLAAMHDFLADYAAGRARGRYLPAALPALPFREGAFELALCSHFLFLYTEQLGGDFHLAAIDEMCRVARDIRIFPLLALGGRRSRLIESSVERSRAAGRLVSIETVPYEFQRGGNQMMRICTTATRQR